MSSDQEGTAFLVVIIDTPGHSQPTLQKMLKQCPDVFDQGSDSIEDYVERNISPELHKATALKVFSIAIKMWGDGIVDASKRAADISGVNAETKRYAGGQLIIIFH